jgi:hypothetical protein
MKNFLRHDENVLKFVSFLSKVDSLSFTARHTVSCGFLMPNLGLGAGFVLFFEIGSSYVVQAGLSLPQVLE